MSTFQHIKRRTFLRGIGTTMALPLLEAMGPRSAVAAGSQTAPTRMAFVFFPNGAIKDTWKSRITDDGYELSPTLEPLEPHKDDFNVFTGLTQHHARANGDGGGDHARNASAFLTGCQPQTETAVGEAGAAPELISRDLFFGNPDKSGVRISPWRS